MARVISVANQKGGVGKTVTSINLAANLAAAGWRTLLVDLDPQGHCALGLGVDAEALPLTITDVLLDRALGLDKAVVALDQPGAERLHLVASDLSLATAERDLERTYAVPVRVLSVKLGALARSYDWVVVDCPPALSRLTLNAFIASDIVVVPVAANFFGLQGVEKMAETLRDLVEELGLTYRVYGLLTRYRKGQTVSEEIRGAMSTLFGERLLETIIHENADVEKATGAGEPLCAYAPSSRGARDYQALTDELMLREQPSLELATAVAAVGRSHG